MTVIGVSRPRHRQYHQWQRSHPHGLHVARTSDTEDFTSCDTPDLRITAGAAALGTTGTRIENDGGHDISHNLDIQAA